MRRRFTLFLAGAALVMFGTLARAQYEPRSVSGLIDRVHADLNHAYEARHFKSHDRKRLEGAEEKLRDFAKKWDRGRFDKGELDEAISSIHHVLDDNHLRREDRSALDSDLSQLRGMREAYDRHQIR